MGSSEEGRTHGTTVNGTTANGEENIPECLQAVVLVFRLLITGQCLFAFDSQDFSILAFAHDLVAEDALSAFSLVIPICRMDGSLLVTVPMSLWNYSKKSKVASRQLTQVRRSRSRLAVRSEDDPSMQLADHNVKLWMGFAGEYL